MVLKIFELQTHFTPQQPQQRYSQPHQEQWDTLESPVQRLRQLIPPTAVVLTGDWDAALFIQQRLGQTPRVRRTARCCITNNLMYSWFIK